MNYGKYFKYYRYPLKVCNSYKRIAKIPNIDHIITVDNYSYKKFDVFKYLGVNINSSNNMHEEIND